MAPLGNTSGPETISRVDMKQTTQVQEALLDAALGYATRGLRVLPIDSTITDPANKRPLITEWQTYATNDPVQVNRWWDRWPDAAIGIVTDGLVILDVDAHGDDGHASLQALIEEFGPLPDTLRATTPRNGVHHYFQFAGEARRVLGFRPGLDLIVSGVKKAFVVAPPSVFPYGSYVWQGPDTVTMAPVPEWLMEVAARAVQARQATPSTAPGRGKDGRHNGLVSVARRLRHGGAGFDEIIAALEAENEKDPLPEDRLNEIEQIATWVLQLPTFTEELARVKQTYSTPRSSRISDLTDHKIVWAFIEAAETAGRLDDLGVSTRRLADSAAIRNRQTIQRSLERLSEVIVPMGGFTRGRARRYRLVVPEDDVTRNPVRTLSEARERFLRLAFGRRQNALRIAQALWAPVGVPMTRTMKELGAALGMPMATVRDNLKNHPAFIRVDRTHWRLTEFWRVALDPDTNPETWFTLTALFADNTGTLAAWNANRERADAEIAQYDQSFRDRYGFDRLTGEILR
jgi:hypothetical protein